LALDGQFEIAYEQLDRCGQRDRWFSVTHIVRGFVLLRQGRAADAAEAFRAALETDSENFDARLGLAEALVKTRGLPSGLHALSDVDVPDGRRVDALLTKAHLMALASQRKKAAATFQSFLQTDGETLKEPYELYELGELFEKNGLPREARLVYRLVGAWDLEGTAGQASRNKVAITRDCLRSRLDATRPELRRCSGNLQRSVYH
jgi:tetratricopeptide (TPR) repeat protein